MTKSKRKRKLSEKEKLLKLLADQIAVKTRLDFLNEHGRGPTLDEFKVAYKKTAEGVLEGRREAKEIIQVKKGIICPN